MILYLYGPNSYRRREKVKWYLGKFKEKHSGITIEEFNLENQKSVDDLRDFIVNQSLFESFKLGLLNRLGEADAKIIIPILKSALTLKNVTLIISEDKKLLKIYDFLMKDSFLAESFDQPSDKELTSFIKK